MNQVILSINYLLALWELHIATDYTTQHNMLRNIFAKSCMYDSTASINKRKLEQNKNYIIWWFEIVAYVWPTLKILFYAMMVKLYQTDAICT